MKCAAHASGQVMGGAVLGNVMVMSRESLPPNMNVLDAFSVIEGRLLRSERAESHVPSISHVNVKMSHT